MPTRGRPDRAAAVIAQVPHRPFIVVVDEGRMCDAPPSWHWSGATIVTCPPQAPGKSNPVPAVEAGIMAARTFYVVVICDDVSFPDGGISWLEQACAVYTREIGDRSGVVAINDGIRDDIACFPLMDKRFYMDHIYPAPYRRYYADTELSAKAKALGVYAVAPLACVKHENIGPHDSDALFEEGRVFERRMEEFFGRMKAES
jgi:hypothetical protein